MALAFALAVVSLPAPAAIAGASLDQSFGEGGVSFPGLSNAAIFGLAQDRDGRLVSAGASYFEMEVARYLPNGSLDTGFGNGGLVRQTFGAETRANALAADDSGGILAAGSTWPANLVLARYSGEGAPDAGFGENGHISLRLGRRGGANAVATMPDGRIVVAGDSVKLSGRWVAFVYAYRANGQLDRQFGESGVLRLTTRGDLPIEIDAMAVMPSGRLLLAGDVNGRVMVVRLRSDGELDPGFSGDGIAYFDLDGSPRCACSFSAGIAVDRRARVLVAANLTLPGDQPAALLRLQPGGQPDPGFGRKGVARTLIGSRLAVHDLSIQKNQKIVLAGAYNVPATGKARVAVVRYQPSGLLDRGFGKRGLFTRDFGSEGVAYAALAQKDGRVVVAGRANRTAPDGGELYDTAEGFLMRFLP